MIRINNEYVTCEITKLVVCNYRNFIEFTLLPQHSKTLIIGNNGTGKTNLLESISLFNPGRGLRAAKYEDILNKSAGITNSANKWLVEAILKTTTTTVKISSDYVRHATKRNIKLNDNVISSSDLLKLINIIWITPQIEGVFQEGISQRRKLLDRLVYLFDNSHAQRVSKYEYYLKERMVLLKNNPSQTQWISIIEDHLSKIAIEIASCRNKVIKQLQQSLNQLDTPFPKVKLDIDCLVEKLYLSQQPSSKLQELFYNSRRVDTNLGRSHIGTHRSDFQVIYMEKNRLAQHCSTGEQKALLISLLIGQMIESSKHYNRLPILLLDELFVHLDIEKRQYLAHFLSASKAQCWISSTEQGDIKLFNDDCHVVNLQ